MTRSCFLFASPGSSSASPSARAGAAIAQSSVSYSSEMLWPMLPRTAPTARPTNKESTRNEPAPIAIQIQTDTVLYLTRSHRNLCSYSLKRGIDRACWVWAMLVPPDTSYVPPIVGVDRMIQLQSPQDHGRDSGVVRVFDMRSAGT